MIRSQTQIIHHNLLILLHLLFMLRDESERTYDYSKTACVYASREILSRWIKFRGFVRVVFCCRWVEFGTFTAAFTLLLAHIDSHSNFAGDQIRNYCLPDRVLVEVAMDTMDELNRVNGDLLRRQTAEVIRKLLDIELNASNGTTIYTAKGTEEEDTEEGSQTILFDSRYHISAQLAFQMRAASHSSPILWHMHPLSLIFRTRGRPCLSRHSNLHMLNLSIRLDGLTPY